MARVFTIIPGLENMGGMKTGGQGSVYKGRRTGEIITAVKILPTPVFIESSDDRNYAAFQNEVSKLNKVNASPNPHVVKILSSGLTDAGNFPYIEMEYIEGPNLEELLAAAHEPIFTLKETLKVAEQIASAIAHCHSLDVRHGDIKSNNVKLNANTGNYTLLDFGLAIMSDEQRRSSVRHTGAIEFMAPEQNTGKMMFQSDVYSYGIILFELLTGTIPFPLQEKTESGRNEVRLAHMAVPVPDLLKLRQTALPLGWSQQKKEREMQLPEWLVNMVYKCLEKKPEKRFANGMELHSYIVQKFVSRPDNSLRLNQLAAMAEARKRLLLKHQELRKELNDYQQRIEQKQSELSTAKELLAQKELRLLQPRKSPVKSMAKVSKTAVVSKGAFTALLLVTFALAAFIMAPVFKNKSVASTKANRSFPRETTGRYDKEPDGGFSANTGASSDNTGGQPGGTEQVPEGTDISRQPQQSPVTGERQNEDPRNQQQDPQADQQNASDKVEQKTVEPPVKEQPAQQSPVDAPVNTPSSQPPNNDESSQRTSKPVENDDNTNPGRSAVTKKYLVVSRAYFYNDPDENTRRDEFISPFEHAVVVAVNERYGFIYVVITNPQGQVFKGWLRKRDLKLYSIE